MRLPPGKRYAARRPRASLIDAVRELVEATPELAAREMGRRLGVNPMAVCRVLRALGYVKRTVWVERAE